VHAVTSDAAFVMPEALFIIGHLAGMLLLGIARWRTRVVPRWAATLVGLACIVQFLVHDQSMLSAYGLLPPGMTACAVTLLRTPPEPGPTSAPADPLVTSAPATRLSADRASHATERRHPPH
jgi:hypothetical protein